LKLSDSAEEIFSGLLDLTREGGPGNFMVISSGDIYVQFSGSPGNPHVMCESISNEYLPKKLNITKTAVKKLKDQGFKLGGDEFKNFSRHFEVSTDEHARELAQLTLSILQKVYGLPKSSELQIEVSLE